MAYTCGKIKVSGLFSVFLKNCFYLTNLFEKAIQFLNLVLTRTQGQVCYKGSNF